MGAAAAVASISAGRTNLGYLLGAVANRRFAITKILDANNSLRPLEDVLGSFLDELSGYRGPDDVGRSNVKLLVKPFWRNSPA